MSAAKKVQLIEVGARDGLQNEKTPIPTELKRDFVRRLVEAGMREIELTSFVRPDWVPQLADAKELSAMVLGQDWAEGAHFSALVPNARGMDSAMAAGLQEVAVFVAASESFSQKNINATIAESLVKIQPVLATAMQRGVKVRGYVSCVFGCPYEGQIDPHKVVEVSKALLDAGCYEVSLGDTIGIGTPEQVRELLTLFQAQGVPLEKLALHVHDTHKRALENIEVAWQMGITRFDASAAGLGGCPYAPGATGNVATEDVVQFFHDRGVETGVDVAKLAQASQPILEYLGRESSCRLYGASMGVASSRTAGIPADARLAGGSDAGATGLRR